MRNLIAHCLIACLGGVLFGAQCLAGPAASYRMSEWSKITSNLSMRVSCPSNCIASPRGDGDFDIYAKCEVRNTGKEAIAVRQRARLYLVDDTGQTTKCQHYATGVYPSPLVRAGEVTSWWENGVFQREGAVKLYACWEEKNEMLQTSAIPITIRQAKLRDDLEGFRRSVLQKHVQEFARLVPNTNLAAASFTKVVFTNEPIAIDGLLYNAFSFVMPDEAGDLIWSLVYETPANNEIFWYIIPEQGTRQGFESGNSETLQIDYPGIGRKGDKLLLQKLERANLTPNQRYLIWFQCPYRDVPAVTVSLNVLSERTTCHAILAHALPADPMQSGPRKVIQYDESGSRRVIQYDK